MHSSLTFFHIIYHDKVVEGEGWLTVQQLLFYFYVSYVRMATVVLIIVQTLREIEPFGPLCSIFWVNQVHKICTGLFLVESHKTQVMFLFCAKYAPCACCLNTRCRPKIVTWAPLNCFKRLKYPLALQSIGRFAPNWSKRLYFYLE